jgi:8-oxo-dGTP pyrophosphatase MutT (NUDIX family)
VLLQELESLLCRHLAEPLPGAKAQIALAPRPRTGWQPGHQPGDCRPGAGLLLLYAVGAEAHLVLTVRENELPQHAGQVSLPGGAVEEGETFAEAALREAEEEIGIDPSAIRLLGCLSPLHIPVSRFILHPLIGVADSRPRLRRQEGEVARILEPSFAELADPLRLTLETRLIGRHEYLIPYIALRGEKIWGATAMVLAEFLTLAGRPPDPGMPEEDA